MPDRLSTFLATFPPSVVAAVDAEVSAGAVVVGPDLKPAEFRRAPLAHLRRVSERLHDLWLTAPAPGRVVWCLAGTVEHGLDDFEVPAVLGREAHLDRVIQVTADHEKRIVALGTLREEAVAVTFRLPDTAADDDTSAFFSAMAQSPDRAAVVFVSASLARRLSSSPATASVRRYVEAGGSLGLRVTREGLPEALGAPVAQASAVAELSGRSPALAWFDVLPDSAHVLDAFMRRAGLSCDTSVPVDEGAAPQGAIARAAAYAGASPYRPQPFSLYVPWFHPDEAPWIELPVSPIAHGGVDAWWAGRRGTSDALLAQLLDSVRMEAFYRASRIDPSLQHDYPNYRIYNWPAPAPAARVTLFDGGEPSPGEAVALLGAIGGAVRGAGVRASLITEAELLTRARREVADRYGITTARAIEAQNEAHEYLATLPHQAPLRPDYADFGRFVAADLGDALELGSGYGVLAWALSLRSRRYTCIDLDHHMFAALRADLGQAGLVADTHRLPFGDGAFDSVIANNVLEHLYDPLSGLGEIGRVLKPGGRVFALLPLDALNSHHALPAHLWKLDEPGLRAGFEAAGFDVARLEIVHLNELGVIGAFPTCHGLAAKIEAVVPVPGEAIPAAVTLRSAPPPAPSRLAGRLLPVVREAVGFERWRGRRVVAVAADQSDLDEFAHFGAYATAAAAELPLAAPDASTDLVYACLSLPGGALDAFAREMHRVLVPGGVAVVVMRHRGGLWHLARLQSYFGEACDLRLLIGADAFVRVAEDDGAATAADYVMPDSLQQAFAPFAQRDVVVRGLTPDDVPGLEVGILDPRFWTWLSTTCGRYVLLRATKQ